MKKIFGISLMVAVLAGGFTANAQTPNATKNVRTEQCDRKGGLKDKKECKHDKECKEFKGNKPGERKHHQKGQRPDLFAGITLSAEQQTKLDALKAEQKAQRDIQKDSKTKMSKEDRQARRAEFSAKVKEILTPEQWAVYEQNVAKMKADRPKKKN